MEGIYDPNSKFAFNQLILTPPTVLSGGNYFIKYVMHGNPLYIQAPKCKTRSGISKSGKRMYCDLMFTNENEEFIRWMEDLETHTCKYIFEHREKWFETEMEMTDIENYFASPVKIYKSGKFYLVRTNISTRLGKMSVKIYDENEHDVDPETIGEHTNIVTILEFQGIKCSARSFQIEIEMKQMLVLQPTDLFEKCILATNKSNQHLASVVSETTSTHDVDPIDSFSNFTSSNTPVFENSEPEPSNNVETSTVVQDDVSIQETAIPSDTETSIHVNQDPLTTTSTHSEVPTDDEPHTFQETPIVHMDLDPYEINLDEVLDTETVQIKPRNDVYYEMYREARKKAKMAKRIALSAYLEAKQIKTTYMLDISEESDDSDLDNDEHMNDKNSNKEENV
jgi:hypothetical protein